MAFGPFFFFFIFVFVFVLFCFDLFFPVDFFFGYAMFCYCFDPILLDMEYACLILN